MPTEGHKEPRFRERKCKCHSPVCSCSLKEQHTFKQGLMFGTKQGWDAHSPWWQHSKGLMFSNAPDRSSLDFLTPCTWNMSPVNGWAGWQLAPGLSTLHGLQHLPPIRKMSWDLHRKLAKKQEKQLGLTAHLSQPPSLSYSPSFTLLLLTLTPAGGGSNKCHTCCLEIQGENNSWLKKNT